MDVTVEKLVEDDPNEALLTKPVLPEDEPAEPDEDPLVPVEPEDDPLEPDAEPPVLDEPDEEPLEPDDEPPEPDEEPPVPAFPEEEPLDPTVEPELEAEDEPTVPTEPEDDPPEPDDEMAELVDPVAESGVAPFGVTDGAELDPADTAVTKSPRTTALRLERVAGSTENELPAEVAAAEADEKLASKTLALDTAGSKDETRAIGLFVAEATALAPLVGRGTDPVTIGSVAEAAPEMISEYSKTVVASPVDV